MHHLHSNITNIWSMPRHKARGSFGYMANQQGSTLASASLAPGRDVSMHMN
ncbi:MAG TPA: hypothetical protein VF438_01050 [Candidatus Paceibacterota bacterium]